MLFLTCILMLILFYFIFSKKENFDIVPINTYLKDIEIYELDINKSSFSPPLNFEKFNDKFLMTVDSQNSLLNYIHQNLGKNYKLHSSPYNIYYNKYGDNQYNFIFVIDVQDEKTFKIESLQISMISNSVELGNIKVLESKKITYSQIEKKAYHKDMNMYRIENTLGVL